MSMNSIVLAYCVDNEFIVVEVQEYLFVFVYIFYYYFCNWLMDNNFLIDQLFGQLDFILFFISDNYFKLV